MTPGRQRGGFSEKENDDITESVRHFVFDGSIGGDASLGSSRIWKCKGASGGRQGNTNAAPSEGKGKKKTKKGRREEGYAGPWHPHLL